MNKEREAFERLPLAELAIKSKYVYYSEETNSYCPNEDFCPSDAPEAMNFAWEAWQVAKAQADQKVKLLLCDEHLKKCESPAGIFNSQYPDEEPCLICLAKEAKAQAVPKWISVKDQLPPSDPYNREYWVYETLNNKVQHDYWVCPDTGLGQDFEPFFNNWPREVTHWMPMVKYPKPPVQAQEPTND